MSQGHDRPARVASEFAHELGLLLSRGLKDPRITALVTVTGAKMAPDLKEITAYVSIAEVAENDLWQRSVLGVTAVSNDHAFVNETLDKVADFVGSMHGGQIMLTGRDLAIEHWEDGLGEGTRTLAEAEGAIPWDPPEGKDR